ncbi:Thg1 C terminal domain-containing protein [Phlebopus sp. FC_14]|nr:Thg1 C terminal domain-containing protein [Phlebopus sp. FC_14]
MANSKYAYVRNFELPDPLLPGCFLVCRLDGHSFHRFSDEHRFTKPNDERALKLMDHAAMDVMSEYKDIVLAFGESDEFSFLLRRSTNLYNRRHAKILTTLTSYFTSCYVFRWSQYFPNTPLRYPPSFDGRIVVYPDERVVRDYFAWRQADTHINNLYNTVFWALVQQGGQTTTEAHAALRGTVSAQKHEILFQRFHINYNELPDRFKKGSTIVREMVRSCLFELQLFNDHVALSDVQETGPRESDTVIAEHEETTPKLARVKKKEKLKTKIEVLHCDIIGDEFWQARRSLLTD